MVKQRLLNLFKKQVKKSTPITANITAQQKVANLILSNAITMEASLNGRRLKIS